MFFLLADKKIQLKEIFYWLSGQVQQQDIILLDNQGRQQAFYFKFPLKIGDKPKKLKNFKDKNLTFIIKFLPSNLKPPAGDWRLIFQSPEIEIFENLIRLNWIKVRPLRWGLAEEHKNHSLILAREAMAGFLDKEKFLRIQEFSSDFTQPLHFSNRVNIGVAVWCQGKIRGSAVVENRIFKEGIVEAAMIATRDLRFKPLTRGELDESRIEITILSDLRVPLNKNLIKQEEIFYNKGYLLVKGNNKGWFLPEVFNVKSFKSLEEFLMQLAQEKAGLLPSAIRDQESGIYIFEVQDFVENVNRQAVTLDGPVAILKNLSEEEKIKSFEAAAGWLLKIQEEDGNFPPIINFLTGRKLQVDWPRSAFTAWALAEFAKSINRSDLFEPAKKCFFYLKKYLLDELIISSINQSPLTIAYLGQLALSLDFWQEANQCALKLLKKAKEITFEPIIFAQVASFLTELARSDKSCFNQAIEFTQAVNQEFNKSLKSKQTLNLAIWAELVNLNLKLFKISDNDIYLKQAEETINWLLSYQTESGAFKSTTNSIFVYTRGSGKIAEVLASVLLIDNKEIDSVIDVSCCEKSLDKVFTWLVQMQYNSENSYFVPSENITKVIGGLRHDYFNTELWIDSAGHLLLAASRYLKARK